MAINVSKFFYWAICASKFVCQVIIMPKFIQCFILLIVIKDFLEFMKVVLNIINLNQVIMLILIFLFIFNQINQNFTYRIQGWVRINFIWLIFLI